MCEPFKSHGELAKMKNIDQALEPFGSCVIIYLTKEHYGHWVCLFRLPIKAGQKKPELEFFDSLANMPDKQLDWSIPEYIRQKNHENYPHFE